MSVAEEVVKALQATFAREPGINLQQYPVRLDFSDGNLTLDGYVFGVDNVSSRRHSPLVGTLFL